MPCSDGGPTIAQSEQENHMRDAIARLACDRCRDLEEKGHSIPDWAKEWWEMHKIYDQRRKQREEEEREQERHRREGLGRLTQDQKKALGLDGIAPV